MSNGTRQFQMLTMGFCNLPNLLTYYCLGLAILFVAVGIVSWVALLTYGIGMTGKTAPVYWGV